jgi:hypothetical protein
VSDLEVPAPPGAAPVTADRGADVGDAAAVVRRFTLAWTRATGALRDGLLNAPY